MKAPALLVAVSLALSLVACASPDPPKLTPVSVALTGISAASMDVNVKLDAENPNRIDLSARSVTAKLTLDGKIDVGTFKVVTPIKLPAQKTTRIDVPLSAKWSELATVISLGAQSRDVPYDIDGTVEMGGDTFHVEVPFHVKGTLTHEQLVNAALSSLPRLPGLPGLPGLPDLPGLPGLPVQR
ncbi:MAG: LEA type 2 family protein [Minicystis sp.]